MHSSMIKIRKPGSATSQTIIMPAYYIGLFTTSGRKKHKQKFPVRT